MVYFLVSLLFLGGMFDGWIEWFNGGAAATLENQLDALRRNGAAPAGQPGAGQPGAGQPGAGQQAPADGDNEAAERAGEAWRKLWVTACNSETAHLEHPKAIYFV